MEEKQTFQSLLIVNRVLGSGEIDKRRRKRLKTLLIVSCSLSLVLLPQWVLQRCTRYHHTYEVYDVLRVFVGRFGFHRRWCTRSSIRPSVHAPCSIALFGVRIYMMDRFLLPPSRLFLWAASDIAHTFLRAYCRTTYRQAFLGVLEFVGENYEITDDVSQT